jgi:hypothetical protein
MHIDPFAQLKGSFFQADDDFSLNLANWAVRVLRECRQETEVDEKEAAK